MSAPLLVFGWGNLSRGDDALGPLFVQQLRLLAGTDAGNRVNFLEDYQLQVEHALDLADRKRVLFVDASVNCAMPFEVSTPSPSRDTSFTTHAISPQALMHVYRDLYHDEPPPCTLLAIRGMHFELGAPPSSLALDHLARALAWGQAWLEGLAAPPLTLSEAAHA